MKLTSQMPSSPTRTGAAVHDGCRVFAWAGYASTGFPRHLGYFRQELEVTLEEHPRPRIGAAVSTSTIHAGKADSVATIV